MAKRSPFLKKKKKSISEGFGESKGEELKVKDGPGQSKGRG